MKGVPFSIEGIRKGCLFLIKVVSEGVRVWTSGRSLLSISFVEYSLPRIRADPNDKIDEVMFDFFCHLFIRFK